MGVLGFVGRKFAVVAIGDDAGFGGVFVGGGGAGVADAAGEEVAADDEDDGEELCGDGFPVVEDGEPGAEPIGEFEVQIVLGHPAGLLHFLDVFADHDDEDRAEHDAGEDKHAFVGEFVVGDEGEHGNEEHEEQSDGDAFHDGSGAELEAIALEEEDDFEAFAVDGGEADEEESAEDGLAGLAGVFGEGAFAAIVVCDPAGPVDLVEEPVHHDQEHHDGEEAGGGLDFQGGDVEGCVKGGEEADDDEPGGDAGEKRKAGTDGDGLPVGFPRADQTGGESGEDQNRFEAFAENEDTGIEDDGGVTEAIGGGVGGASGGEGLPDEDGEYEEACEDDAGSAGEDHGGAGEEGHTDGDGGGRLCKTGAHGISLVTAIVLN